MMENMLRILRHPIIAAMAAMVAAAALAGCESTTGSLGKRIDYKSTTSAPALELPPELSAPRYDDRFAVQTATGYAAANAARRGRVQVSLNLAFGSAIASIGLTIPTLAVASIWIPTPLHLGLGPTQVVLLAITLFVAVLTVVPGRATRLHGVVHLTLFAAFLFLSMSP